VARCQACGLAFTVPRVPDSEIGRYYPAAYYGDRNRRFNPLFEKLIRFFRWRRVAEIERRVKTGRVLDVGCGRALTLDFMRARGWEAYGVELSETSAAHAREVLGLPVFVGPLENAPHPPASFDVVILWHVLEHFAHPGETLRRCRELLRPGGLLVVAVPNFASLQAGATGPEWFHLDVPRHYVHFALPVLTRTLVEHGFRVDTVSHFGFEQNPYGWIQSLLNRAGFRRNLLYDLLKDRSARSEAAPVRAHPLQSLLLLPALLFVVPLSLLLFGLELLLRRGGTVEVYATRDTSP